MKTIGGALGEALGQSERQRQFEHDKWLTELAVLRMKGELAAELELAKAAQAGEREQADKSAAIDNRRIGTVKQQAIMAAFAVFADTYGTPNFPRNEHAMARAIVNRASDLGIAPNAKMDPRSTSVKDVAALAVRTQHLLDNQDEKNSG